MAYEDDAYLQSLQAAQGDVNRHLSTALAEIARQRDVAAAQLPKMQLAAGEAANGAKGGLMSMLQSVGINHAAPSLTEAFTNTNRAYGRAGGLLSQGFMEQASRRGASANGIATSLSGDIQGKIAEQYARRQQEDRERSFQAQMAAQQRALQEELAGRAQAQAAASARAQQEAEFMALLQYLSAMQPPPPPGVRPLSAPTQPTARAGKRRGNYL